MERGRGRLPSVEAVGLGLSLEVDVEVVFEEEDFEGGLEDSEKPLMAILGGGIESAFAGDIFAQVCWTGLEEWRSCAGGNSYFEIEPGCGNRSNCGL